MVDCIMCTLTAAQIADEPLVEALHSAGMRAVRINTAHLSGIDELQLMAAQIKSLHCDIRILIDTKGPEMRTTATDGDTAIALSDGTTVYVRGTADDQTTTSECIHVNYPLLHTEVHRGDTLLIDDGKIELTVTDVTADIITALVTRGGSLGSRKGMSVAGVDINLPAVSPRDRMYIHYAASCDDIDVIAHSFVRSASDVLAVKEAMRPGSKPVIAKIENHQGISALADIIKVSDGILIARGDLTACIGADAVPQVQSLIAEATTAAELPLYLATNILASMMSSPTPSAHDIEGIRLAVSQGVDIMLLTNETAAGAYPVETVKALRRALQ